MKKPIIGISTSLMYEEKDKYFFGYEYSYVASAYVEAVEKSGAVPLMLPRIDDDENIKTQISMLDGLIISGGYDTDPQFYNEQPLEKLGDICPKRDIYELKLIKYATELKIPILGICRGHQLINVAFGGSLYQDLSYREIPNIKHSQDAPYFHATHSITIKKDSILYSIAGDVSENVNSYHHQAIKKVAPNFKSVAQASDGIIEAIEYLGDDNFVMGVQFHPEMLFKNSSFAQKIFEKFVDVCKK